MIDIKKSKAPTNTVTLDKLKIEEHTGNIFEAIAIMASRTEQISLDIRKELLEKLDEFALQNEQTTGNIFESIAIMARRTEQFSLDIRKELLEKLDEFAMHN